MTESEILVKLKALKTQVNSPTGVLSGVHVDDYEKYIASFEKYFKELVDINPELYGDFTPNKYIPYMANDEYIGLYCLTPLNNNIQYLLDIAPDITAIKPSDFKITTEGIFFSGQYFDAFVKVSEILKSATKEIILIDGYINDQFIDIFTVANTGVQIKILTKSKSNTAAVKLKITSFNKQFNSQGINLEIRENEDFHDRFLILDQNQFFHFGASLKDLGNKGFMFSRIEEPFVQKSLLTEFNTKW
ncbi:MAG: hypothetical protein KGM16_09390 [Bacteroidota bacterium]|nr:hypothetical protein [Bacteroidota bacterium]